MQPSVSRLERVLKRFLVEQMLLNLLQHGWPWHAGISSSTLWEGVHSQIICPELRPATVWSGAFEEICWVEKKRKEIKPQVCWASVPLCAPDLHVISKTQFWQHCEETCCLFCDKEWTVILTTWPSKARDFKKGEALFFKKRKSTFSNFFYFL